MSYYTTQVHLIKCNDSVLPQIQEIIEQYMQHAPDEVYIEVKPELYRGCHLVECSGRKTTFGNFFYRIAELSRFFKEWLYLDYDDGGAHCSSNFAKYIFVEDDSKPIAWIEDGADIGELQTLLCEYFKKTMKHWIL